MTTRPFFLPVSSPNYSLAEGLAAVRYLTNSEMLEDGKLTFGGGTPAIMFICFLAILIVLNFKTIRNRKEAVE